MSQDGFSLSVTLKGGVGYDAPWVVIYGNTPDEVTQKLQSIANGSLIEATVVAANALKAGNRAAPLAQGGPDAYASGSSFGGGDHGLEAPPQQEQQQSSGWGNSNSGGGGGQRQDSGWNRPAPRKTDSGPTHPGGLTCHCGQAAEFKRTGSGKEVWRCPQWRWNNGSPNDHLQEWAS